MPRANTHPSRDPRARSTIAPWNPVGTSIEECQRLSLSATGFESLVFREFPVIGLFSHPPHTGQIFVARLRRYRPQAQTRLDQHQRSSDLGNRSTVEFMSSSRGAWTPCALMVPARIQCEQEIRRWETRHKPARIGGGGHRTIPSKSETIV